MDLDPPVDLAVPYKLQRGMIAADYAKDLAKQLSLTKKELENARSIQDNRADSHILFRGEDLRLPSVEGDPVQRRDA